ncbi:ANTAR domain-containing protein [Amycolatopsis carbonis]|uniref:ANTAR domain-containing protein n=1 Tax=Amycolatopsis carbonis TaxID=715471 RepID=A0A9Y2MVK1_9PSEU|nr:ANTAR domain-containing protein [Amycolatopsis sp. 2-15]WIX76812.1 ANTAR domain-containing protein [Amycolatopsis sp. 2-15]
MFVIHAAIALVGAQTEAHLPCHGSRGVIGMVKGILMQRRDVDATPAFRVLVDASQHGNMTLHEVAAWLVEHRRDL